MGIYTDGNVYGIYCFDIDDSGNMIVLIDKKYDAKMSLEQVKEVKIEYDKLSEDIKKQMRIKFYTSICCTYELYGNKPSISTWPGNIKMLEELFDKGDIRI